MTGRYCTNKACSLRGIRVATQQMECIGCGHELFDNVIDAFRHFSGIDDLASGSSQ